MAGSSRQAAPGWAWLRLSAAIFVLLPLAAAAPAESPSLTEVVLFGLRPASQLAPSRYRPEGRRCVETYLQAISHHKQLRAWKTPAGPEQTVAARRRNLEFHLALVLGDAARSEAKAFAAAVPLQIEWEGMSEGPLEEADFGRQWLETHPNTPLQPFLHLFMAHRFRAAYETSRREHAKMLTPLVAGLYREHLAAARGSSNGLIACIADDLEAQPHVYLSGFGRP